MTTTEKLLKIKAELREIIALSEKIPAFIPQTPTGGLKIYQDIHSYHPIATFANEDVARFACEIRTITPKMAVKMLAVIDRCELALAAYTPDAGTLLAVQIRDSLCEGWGE